MSDHTTDDVQEQYWTICDRAADAVRLLNDAGDAANWSHHARVRAVHDELNAFAREHAGRSFRMFRPEIEAELTPEQRTEAEAFAAVLQAQAFIAELQAGSNGGDHQ